MSRASYGADVFSPVKGNGSFNDDVLSAGSESDFSDQWREPNSAVGKHGISEAKKKTHHVPFLHTDEASCKSKVPENLQSTIKIDKVVGKKNKKNSSLEADFTKLSYVTTRTRSSHKSKRELEEIQQNQPTQIDIVSKTKKKSSVTVRPEADSNKKLLPNKTKRNKESASSITISSDSSKELHPNKTEQNKESASSMAIPADANTKLLPNHIKQIIVSESISATPVYSNEDLLPNKIKQTKESFSLSLVSLAEDQAEKSPAYSVLIGSMKSDHNDLSLSEVPAQTCKVLSKSNVMLKNKKSEKISEMSLIKRPQTEKPVSTFNCKMNNLKLPEEVGPDKENRGESAVTESSIAESVNSSLDFKPEQIQANIIEKLVRDAVSFEFDGIRQMLYLQHLQLLNYIDRNAVNYDLRKTVEELVEENRRLKDIIAHQNI